MTQFWPKICSSGDFIADRRYAYAQAAEAEGDYEAAIDLLDQTLELAPHWAAAWFSLGMIRESQSRRDEAIAAFSRALAVDSGDEFGASLQLARLGVTPRPDGAPAGYVRNLFDQYAGRFEAHLCDGLSYRGPTLLADAIDRIEKGHFGHVIDLGCGTGLCAPHFRARAERLTGVDLSSAMIKMARSKKLYDRLEMAEIGVFLDGEPAANAALILAADVFVYFGDLLPVFCKAIRIIEPGGLFAFTLQSADDDYKLGLDMRFAHSRTYVQKVAQISGFEITFLESAWARHDKGVEVPGLVVVLRRREK
jgi:predicted TPR repeat methyltransferase